MKKFALLFILLYLTSNLYSQNQKVAMYLNNGDMLDGFGMITKNHKIKFRYSLEEKPDTWTSRMVKEIIFYGIDNGRTFEYIKISKNQKPVLLEVVSYGKVNLYKYYNSYDFFNSNSFPIVYSQNYGSSLFVKREKEKIATALSGNLKKMALRYFNDCDFIQEIIDTREILKYSKEDLVEEYNYHCND